MDQAHFSHEALEGENLVVLGLYFLLVLSLQFRLLGGKLCLLALQRYVLIAQERILVFQSLVFEL